MPEERTWTLSEQEREDMIDVMESWLEDHEYDRVAPGADVSPGSVAQYARVLRFYYVCTGNDWQHTSGPYTLYGVPITNERFGKWWEPWNRGVQAALTSDGEM